MTTTVTSKPPEDKFARAMRTKEEEIAKRLVTDPPPGQRYEALVPDTLDLAERCALALNCQIEMIEPDLEHVQYDTSYFDGDPACMQTLGGSVNIAKTVEALPQVRLASGSTQALDRERALMLRVLAQSWDDGAFYAAPAEGRPWIDPTFAERADMDMVGRLLRGVLCWYQYNGSPLWLEHAHKIYRTIRDKLVRYEEDGGAFFPPASPEWGYLPKSGYPADLPKYGHPRACRGSHAAILGYNLAGVSKYAAMTGNAEALELARKMVSTLRTRKFWERGFGFVERPGIVAEERAHFWGHGQTNLMTLRGLLEYGDAANDTDVKEFVRSGYEFWRCYGIPDIGFITEDLTGSANGEGCCIASMTILAIRLSQSGVGDYWEDVDRFVRNGLTEWQLVDQAQLERCCKAGPRREPGWPGDTTDRVIERSLGSFCGNPFVTDYPRPRSAGCCTQNGAQALYQAWETIVQDRADGLAQVNLLLNRACPQLDLDSYLPYEGKVVVRNKTARTVCLRIPNWVPAAEVRCQVDARPVTAHWLNNYLLVEGLQRGTEVVIEFPVVERTIRKTLGASSTTYTIDLRGNTVVDISPRDEDSPQGIRDGALWLSRPVELTVAGVREKDVRVSVEADSSAYCGILLRYQHYWDYLAAIYDPHAETIYIGRIDAGVYSTAVSPPDSPYGLSAKGLGPEITLTAAIEGNEVALTVTDGKKTFELKGAVEGARDIPGSVGVNVSHHSTRAQWYKDFRVEKLDGELIFKDKFEGPDGPPAGWEGINKECDYLFYQRNHMRREKAPMAKKTRFIPDHVIKP